MALSNFMRLYEIRNVKILPPALGFEPMTPKSNIKKVDLNISTLVQLAQW